MSKSPFLSGTATFFFYGGWPNVILTFSPSLYVYYIIHYYLHISTHSTCDLEKVSQVVPSLGMMSLQLGLWTWSTVIKQDLTKSLSCNRVSGMASMSNPSGCPQANFCTFVPVHQIPCLGFQAIWCHSQGKEGEKKLSKVQIVMQTGYAPIAPLIGQNLLPPI